jgi:hypothetical protein
MVVTWLLAHNAADKGLPMPKEILDALTMELLIMGASVGSIRNTWSAIENRHRLFGHTPPLSEPGAFRRGIKALSSLRGQPSKLVFPLGRRHVKALLNLIGLTWTQKRNVLLVVTGTTMCARVSEPANLRICNVFLDLDAPYDPQYLGGIGLKIVKKEKRHQTEGHHDAHSAGPLCGPHHRVDRGGGAGSTSSMHARHSTGSSLPILPTLVPEDRQVKACFRERGSTRGSH